MIVQKQQQQQQPTFFCTSWGMASKGQLGSAINSVKSVNAMQITPIDSQDSFYDISCAENHTLMLTDSLQILSCGSNAYGQLGIGSNSIIQQSRQQNQAQSSASQTLNRVTQFNTGSSVSAVSSSHQQSRKNGGATAPIRTFEQIACGSEHSFALSTEGELFSWGLNFKGQLGLGDFENRREPNLVESLNPSSAASALNSNSNQLKKHLMQQMNKQRSKSKEGGVQHNDGKNTHRNEGKSNLNASQKDLLKPSKSVDITSYIAGNAVDGSLYDEMMFGNIESEVFLFKPQEKVEQVVCGSIHSMIRTNMHRIFSCGNGSTFALGHQTKESCCTFRQIEFFNGGNAHNEDALMNVGIKTIACGLSHSGCVTMDGQVYVWGLTGDIQSNKELVLEKCLLKKPTHISLKNFVEVTGNSNAGSSTHRRKSTQQDESVNGSSPQIEELKMGEYFTIALSTKGVVYSWGMNDKGQLGIGTEVPSLVPQQVQNLLPKIVQKIDCGLKHCIALTKDQHLFAWGSNQLSQLGKVLPNQKTFTSIPVQVSAFDTAKPFKIVCGSYHNVCLSYRLPKVEEQDENQTKVLGQKTQNMQIVEDKKVLVAPAGEHRDDDCPNMETIKKLKGEIKRLRQELIMKPSGSRQQQNHLDDDSDEDLDDDYGLDEEEKAALRMLSPEQRKMFAELEQAGANKKYLKKKLKQALLQTQQAFFSNEARAFIQNNEIPFKDLQFDRKLSEGGYGIVYRGRWKHTVVAIKEIKKEIIEQDKLEEFKNECAVMEVIRHPNIVLFLGACTKQPNLCIVLEYCSRGSLWSLLHDQSIKMNWEYRKKFALDIAKGVYYLHTNKQPILHRDLKSLNILLDHALTCKLADFGWTRIKAKVMTSKIGTYQWMAPEVIRGFKYTEKADVFSFGVILWELATRKPPYYGIDGQVVSQRVVKDGLRPKISEKECPGPFLDLMRRCWDEDQEKRPLFGEIIRDLESMNFKNIT